MCILAPRKIGDARQIDLLIPVAAPVGMGNDVRIVRVGHRHDETERSAVAAASEVEELLARGDHDLVVEVDLVCARAGARLDDRIHIVVPAGTLLEGAPVGVQPKSLG